MSQKVKKRGLTTAPKDLKFGSKSIAQKNKSSFQTKTTNYSSTAPKDFTTPTLWKSFKATKDPKILLNSMLYSKYSSSQNYHYLKDINDILLQERTSATLAYKQSQDLLNLSENLDTFFDIEEYDPQMEDIVEYYKYHNEIPRYFGKDIYQVYFDHYDKKRKLNYKRITRKMKLENGENPDESQEKELEGKRKKYYTPMLLNVTKTEEHKKKEELKKKSRISNTIENIYRNLKKEGDSNSYVQFSTPRSINSISFKYTEMSDLKHESDINQYFEEIRLRRKSGNESEGVSKIFKKKKGGRNVVKGEKGGVLGFFEKLKGKKNGGNNFGILNKKIENKDIGGRFANAFREFTSTYESLEPSVNLNGKFHKKSGSKKSKKSLKSYNSGSNFFKTLTTKNDISVKKTTTNSKSNLKRSQKSVESTLKKTKNLNNYTSIFKNLRSFRSLDKQQKRKNVQKMVSISKKSKTITVKSQRHKRSKSDFNSTTSKKPTTASYRTKYETKNFIKDLEGKALKKMNNRLKSRKTSVIKKDDNQNERKGHKHTQSLRDSKKDLDTMKKSDNFDYKANLELFKQKRKNSKNKNSTIGLKGTITSNSIFQHHKKKPSSSKMSLKSRKESKRREKLNGNSGISNLFGLKKTGKSNTNNSSNNDRDTFNGNIYEIREKLRRKKVNGKRSDLIKQSLNGVGFKRLNLFKDNSIKDLFGKGKEG